MGERPPGDLLSQLVPDEIENALGLQGSRDEQQDNVFIASLKAAAGQSGELVDAAVSQFLNGEGALFDATRTASTRGRKSAEGEVASFLTSQLKLSPAAAKLIAMLAVKLFPAIGKLTGQDTAEKKKPRRKKKPKTPSSAKTEAGSKAKPKKKKTTTRPKPAAKKPSAKKKPAAKKKPKKSTKADTAE